MLATRIISHRLVQASHKAGIRAQKKKSCQKKLKNLTFHKDKKTKKPSQRDSEMNQSLRKDFDPRKLQERQLTNERVSEFFNSIKECVLYSIEHAKDNGLPPPLLEKAIDFMSSEEIKNKSVEEAVPLFICTSQITSEQVIRVEHETRGQHASDTWRQQRIGRITASNFHKVYTKSETIMKTRQNAKKKSHSTVPPYLTLLMSQRIFHTFHK